jgi:hypothetical protein
VIALLAGLGVLVLSTSAVAAAAALRAGRALDRETTPFRWRRLDPPARTVAAHLLRWGVRRAVLGYLGAMIPAIGLVVVVTTLFSLVLGLSLGLSEAVRGLSMGGVLLAGASGIGAAVVIRELLRRDEVDRGPTGWFFSPGPVGQWFAFTPSDRSDLGELVLEQHKRSQQEELDTAATEVAAALGRVRSLSPVDLRAAVATQLALWQSETSSSVVPARRSADQALRQVDRFLERLDRERAEGVDDDEARKFWYTAVLRTLRRCAGPRAVSGVMAAGQDSGVRPVARRAGRADGSSRPTRGPVVTEPGVEVIDLRRLDQEPPSEPGHHRREV